MTWSHPVSIANRDFELSTPFNFVHEGRCCRDGMDAHTASNPPHLPAIPHGRARLGVRNLAPTFQTSLVAPDVLDVAWGRAAVAVIAATRVAVVSRARDAVDS